jgi:hypothetical protein
MVMRKVVLVLTLILGSNFAFADLALSPLDFAIPLALLAIIALFIIGIVSAGIFLIYKLYLKMKKSK